MPMAPQYCTLSQNGLEQYGHEEMANCIQTTGNTAGDTERTIYDNNIGRALAEFDFVINSWRSVYKKNSGKINRNTKKDTANQSSIDSQNH